MLVDTEKAAEPAPEIDASKVPVGVKVMVAAPVPKAINSPDAGATVNVIDAVPVVVMPPTRGGDPLYARVADETAGWVMREMQTADGGYCSSLDADSEGEEGKFYVWDRADLARILTSQESALAARRWGFDGPPNFENRHWHAKIAGDLQPGEQSLLDSARQKLFAAESG